VTEVAMELVRKASTRRPVGISNVLIVESKDVAINHLESGENVYLSASYAGYGCVDIPYPIYVL